MKRIFLGWHRPLLHITADYLIENHTTADGCLDLRSVSLVLPGQRAKFRLEEILAERAASMDNPAWYPPDFLTPDSLPEKFYKIKKPLAEPLTQYFAWIDAAKRLHKDSPDLLKQLLPKPPSDEHFTAWLSLGQSLARLHYELASEGVDFATVVEKCGNIKDEAARWEAIKRLHEMYAHKDTGYLDRLGLWDKQSARLFAIHHQTAEERDEICKRFDHEARRFYLVGLVDMNKQQKEILGKYSQYITALIFAPQNDKEIQSRFDEFGCLTTAWCDAPLEIEKEHIEIAWQPQNQADEVLARIESFKQKYASGEIIVSVHDKQVVPFVQQRLTQVGLPWHIVAGASIRHTRPFRLLESLMAFLKSRTFRAYAEWLRHPDVAAYVESDVISLLDEYHNKFYPTSVSDEWKDASDNAGKEDGAQETFAKLKSSWDKLKTLVGASLFDSSLKKELLPHWIDLVRAILKAIFPHQNDEHAAKSMKHISRALETMYRLPSGFAERFSLAETLELLLLEIETERIATEGVPNAVELTGWLDVPLDDAPAVIVTGMNDGAIPSYTTADTFLPDQLRQTLQLRDNRQRCARDAYNVTVVIETRKNSGGDYLFVAGRRSVEGDPLLPSRFLFASADKRKVAERLRDFFKEETPEKTYQLFAVLSPNLSNDHSFVVPPLPNPERPIDAVSVTKLADYVKCPYRFYLKNQLKLKQIDDTAEEMQGFDIGNLVHEVLRRFGVSDCKNSTDSAEIEKCLADILNRYVKERFVASPRAAITFQVSRTRARLQAFAKWQAEWRKQGYEIANVELPIPQIVLGGVELRGRIDRIDRNARTGEIVVIDYKTGLDADPNKDHQKSGGDWIGFQLPLYCYILRKSGYIKPSDKVSLGYLVIPSDVDKVAFNPAKWSEAELQEAIDRAKELLIEINTNDWTTITPTTPAPQYSEDTDFICHNV